jgi:hypothetical protein
MTASGDDRGESTVQVLLTMPTLVLLMLIGLQLSIHAHTAHVATAAAAHGAAVGSTPVGTQRTAEAAARRFSAELGATLVATTAGVAEDRVWVRVGLRVPRLVPLFPATVNRRVSEPRERLLREWER